MDARTLTPFLVISGCLLGLAIVACDTRNGTPAAGGETGSNPVSAGSGTAVAAAAGQTPLVGTWYGRATIDQELVHRYLLSLQTIPQQQQFRSMVESFVSTDMAARFLPTGEMQMEVEIKPVGQNAVKGATRGTWRVINHAGDSVTIECTEYNNDGSQSISQARYVFSADKRQAFLAPSVDPGLAMCGAMIVFDRIAEPDQVANQNGADPRVR